MDCFPSAGCFLDSHRLTLKTRRLKAGRYAHRVDQIIPDSSLDRLSIYSELRPRWVVHRSFRLVIVVLASKQNG